MSSQTTIKVPGPVVSAGRQIDDPNLNARALLNIALAIKNNNESKTGDLSSGFKYSLSNQNGTWTIDITPPATLLNVNPSTITISATELSVIQGDDITKVLNSDLLNQLNEHTAVETFTRREIPVTIAAKPNPAASPSRDDPNHPGKVLATSGTTCVDDAPPGYQGGDAPWTI